MKTITTIAVFLFPMLLVGQQIQVVKQSTKNDAKYKIASEQAERLIMLMKRQALKEELQTGQVDNAEGFVGFLDGLNALMDQYRSDISSFDTVEVAKDELQSELLTLKTKTDELHNAYDANIVYTTGEYKAILNRISEIEKQLAEAKPIIQIKPWNFPVSYLKGDMVTYMADTWVCIQGHTSQKGWTPDVVPALWNKKK